MSTSMSTMMVRVETADISAAGSIRKHGGQEHAGFYRLFNKTGKNISFPYFFQ